MPAQWNG